MQIMTKTYNLVVVILMVHLSAYIHAQTPTTDSLIRIINTSTENNEKFKTILELNEQSINPDILLPYISVAEEIAKRSKNETKISETAFLKAGYYARKNMIDSGLAIIESLVAAYKNHKNKEAYLKYIFFRAKILDRGNRYSQSLVQLYEVVETAKTQKDTFTLIQAKTGIGWVLIEMEQYKEALKWLHDARSTSHNQDYYKNYGALFSNLAAAYNGLGNKDSSLFYIQKAIGNARQNNNLLFLATALSMQAKIFVDNGMSTYAEAPLNEVLEIRKQLNDPFYIVFDMSSLASYYAKNNQPQKGIALCKEGITLAKQLGLPSQLLMIYKSLAENYKAAGHEEEYGKTLEYIISLKDSFNNINSAKMLAELHEANETKKREKTITEQKLNLTLKNYLLFGSALFLVMAGIIAWLAFKNYRRRQKMKMQLAIEKEKMIAAQAVKDAGEQERKRIAADLHDNLGAQANAILYSTELLQQEKEQKEELVNDLHHTAKDMLTSLRETLWVLKKNDVNAADIWIRIINFSQQISRHYPEIKINTEGTAPDYLHLNSAKALNIVFIIQEAVNNALRHSSAKEIQITSEYNPEQWKLSVVDDGKGFDTEAVNNRKESYGLHNMKERAEAALLQFDIKTEPGQGTIIALAVATKELIQKEY
jgi:signal transduction histidine kinase